MNANKLATEPTARPTTHPLEPTQIALRVVAVLLAVLPLTLILTATAWSAPRESAAVESTASWDLGSDDARLDWAPYLPADPVEAAQE